MTTTPVTATLKRACVYLAGALIFYGPIQAFGAEVKGVNTKKKVVGVDQGTLNGFSKGTSVCIYKAGKEIACGTVVNATKNTSSIKITDVKALKKIKPGYEARSENDTMAGGTKSRSASSKHRRNAKLMFLPGLISPATFQRVNYARPDSGVTAVNSLWASAEGPGMALLGFGGEAEFPVGKRSIAGGARFHQFRPNSYLADYDPKDQHQYVQIDESASAIGFWLDYYALEAALAKKAWFRINTGLDLDRSTITLKAQQLNDDPAKPGTPAVDLASVTSTLNVISFRFGGHLNYFLDPLGLDAGINLFIPLVAMGGSQAISDNDPNVSKLGGLAGEDDLAQALGHKKAQYGAEGIIAAYFAF